MRPGSANDKAVLNYPQFGTDLPKKLPPGKHIVADAGYTLSNIVMTLYPVEERMKGEEAWYNYLHSKTRITVERAIGMVKNRFRIFKVPMNQKADQESGRSATDQMGRIIATCLVLHNILIDAQDPVQCIAEESEAGEDQADVIEAQRGDSVIGKQQRDAIKQYLFSVKKTKSVYYHGSKSLALAKTTHQLNH